MNKYEILKMDKNNWYDVFSASVGKVMLNQQRFRNKIVKGKSYKCDLEIGIIKFGWNKYKVQVLGTESNVSNSWLWSWENIKIFPDNILTFAKNIKEIGNNWELEPLYTPKFELTEYFNGHSLAVVACALSDKEMCYYSMPTNNGAVFVAIEDIQDKIFNEANMIEFSNIIAQCAEKMAVNHKLLVEGFLLDNNTPYTIRDNCIIAHFDTDLFIQMEKIEDFWRISKISNKLS